MKLHSRASVKKSEDRRPKSLFRRLIGWLQIPKTMVNGPLISWFNIRSSQMALNIKGNKIWRIAQCSSSNIISESVFILKTYEYSVTCWTSSGIDWGLKSRGNDSWTWRPSGPREYFTWGAWRRNFVSFPIGKIIGDRLANQLSWLNITSQNEIKYWSFSLFNLL